MAMGIPLRAAAILAPFAHGFTTRRGGVSEGCYSSLNVGLRWGDDPARVRENRSRVLATSGASHLYMTQQVHGRDVVRIGPQDDPHTVAQQQADGVVVQGAGCGAAVMTADCVPLLIADPDSGACAAVHAGWRGTTAAIAEAAVRALRDTGSGNPSRFRAAIGPSIGPCCFEVGPDVVAAFKSRLPDLGDFVSAGHNGKAHIDLWQANRRLLERAGLAPECIEVVAACTMCRPDEFFSYRREGAKTGQMMAFIVAR